MIPADFPNKKIKVLPQLLMQAFPVTIVGYIELTTAKATALLGDLKLRHQIIPPISGPQIERAILKIQKQVQEEAEEEAKAQQARMSGGSPSEMIRFSGESKVDDRALISGASHHSPGQTLSRSERAQMILSS